MQNITFDDGYKSYMINGDETKIIRVNISDLNIEKRYNDMKDKMSAEIDRMKEADVTPELLAQADKNIRANLDYVFGSDICTAAFGATNILSPLVNGKLLIESFLDAFLPMITEDIKSISIQHKNSFEDKTAKYITPVIGNPTAALSDGQSFNLENMTDDQKNELLRLLLK